MHPSRCGCFASHSLGVTDPRVHNRRSSHSRLPQMECYKHFLGQFIRRQSPSRPQSPTQAKEDRAMRARKVMARLAAGQTNASQLGLPPLVPIADSPYQGHLNAEYKEAHAFDAYANWIIPGRVLVGRYPYIEPSRCVDRGTGEQQLRGLLEAGVDTFVCLQAELPPQEELPTGGIRGFYPYKPTATMLASSMGAPPSVEITGSIRNNHLDKFLPPRRSTLDAKQQSQEKHVELEFLHNPIVDLDIPSHSQVDFLLEDLSKRLGQGAVLYLHCWGGRGRAGTIAACLLGYIYRIGGGEALKRVQLAFETRADNKAYSPETFQQREFVQQYIFHHFAATANGAQIK